MADQNSSSNSTNAFIKIQNPLFVHPSKSRGLNVTEKLIGSQNYRAWRRYVEIVLVSKWKLTFVQGLTSRPAVDVQKAEQWDT